MAVYNVGGFKFDNEETAKKAAKELKATQYILDQLKNADDEAVLSIYNRLIAQNIFETELGHSFLKQMEHNLASAGLLVAKEDSSLKPKQPSKEATASATKKEHNSDKKVKRKQNKTKTTNSNKDKKGQYTLEEKYRCLSIINKCLIVLCIGLVISIAAMFYINSTINSPTILNYEEEILNKYSDWEQELTEREEALRQKEIEQQNK